MNFPKNLNWENCGSFVDGWLPKLSLFVPVVGYLILFNDSVAKYVEFEKLSETAFLFLSASDRLKLIYYGLLFLGSGNFLFRIRRPLEFKLGSSWVEYTKNCLEMYTNFDYVTIISQMKKRTPHSQQAFTDLDQWESHIGSSMKAHASDSNWEDVKKYQRDMLLGVLWENFAYASNSRRISLIISVVLATIGYILLVIPSADLFFKVLMATF